MAQAGSPLPQPAPTADGAYTARRSAEVAQQYLHKGSYVYVEGPLTQWEWADREGVRRTSLEVRARELRMLDRAADRQGEPAMATASAPAATSAAPVDKIPF